MTTWPWAWPGGRGGRCSAGWGAHWRGGWAGGGGRGRLGRRGGGVPGPYLLAFSRWMCVRARFTEDMVEQAVASGTGQYVILGAGLDSFACRRGDLLGRLRVF